MSQKHFALIYEFEPDFMERRTPHRQAHLALAGASAARDELQLGGPIPGEPPLGLMIFKGDGPAAAEAFARADPYVIHGVAKSWRVREWVTSVGALAPTPR